MINKELTRLMQCFPRSYVNGYGEIIIDHKTNKYFKVDNIEHEVEFKYKVLEWLSRAAYKEQPYKTAKSNLRFNQFILNGINEFLDTKFTFDDMRFIYGELGNNINRELTIKFVESGYNMELLKLEE